MIPTRGAPHCTGITQLELNVLEVYSEGYIPRRRHLEGLHTAAKRRLWVFGQVVHAPAQRQSCGLRSTKKQAAHW